MSKFALSLFLIALTASNASACAQHLRLMDIAMSLADVDFGDTPKGREIRKSVRLQLKKIYEAEELGLEEAAQDRIETLELWLNRLPHPAP